MPTVYVQMVHLSHPHLNIVVEDVADYILLSRRPNMWFDDRPILYFSRKSLSSRWLFLKYQDGWEDVSLFHSNSNGVVIVVGSIVWLVLFCVFIIRSFMP